MTAPDKALVAGLKGVGVVLKEIISESQEIMKMNPINSLVMLNLYGNLGYALMNTPNKDGMYAYGGMTYASQQDVIAEVFRDSAEKTGALLTMEAVSQVFSLKLDLAKIATSLAGGIGG